MNRFRLCLVVLSGVAIGVWANHLMPTTAAKVVYKHHIRPEPWRRCPDAPREAPSPRSGRHL